MFPIVARNVLLVLTVCLIWDGALLGVFRARMAPHKFNPAYPALFERRQTAPIARDAAWTCVSACVAAAYEIGVRHLWATGRLAYGTVPGAEPGTDGAWWAHGPTLLWMATWFYWQNIQFYAMHRCMHKWGTTSVPDVGAWLYRHVHALHHEARNPTAFSGLAMHPVESAAFLSVALVPVLCGAHPAVFLYLLLNLQMSPAIGHSGFEDPGGGSQAHWLHHSLVNCNYAENVLPMDWLFGTFAADEAGAAASMERRRLLARGGGGGPGSGGEAAGAEAAPQSSKKGGKRGKAA
jgi:sterol desaturase/sphingolipid hydroxylase (fatty acid hydroxylase superfamily)